MELHHTFELMWVDMNQSGVVHALFDVQLYRRCRKSLTGCLWLGIHPTVILCCGKVGMFPADPLG
jgi:hypothetical protein